jgi:hypothetical protein
VSPVVALIIQGVLVAAFVTAYVLRERATRRLRRNEDGDD